MGEAVEYDTVKQYRFDIQKQANLFLQDEKANIVACGTCMNIHKRLSSKSCPMGGIEDLYSLIATSDKVLTF